jgi:S-adenosylmethionine hydrolase
VAVVDVSHGIPPQNVLAGALVLRAAAPYFPPRTIHVAVVDPGVGTERNAICVETTDAVFIGPDNGVLSLAAPLDRAIRAVAITNEKVMLSPRSATFHGRDVFAPAAAAVAAGMAVGDLGDEIVEIAYLDLPAPERHGDVVRGQVIYVDHFGNLATNVDASCLPAVVDRVQVGGRTIERFLATYAGAPAGELLALVNSWNVLEIALRDGDARALLGVDVGAPVTVVGG